MRVLPTGGPSSSVGRDHPWRRHDRLTNVYTHYLCVVLAANRRRVFKPFACSILIISYSRGTRPAASYGTWLISLRPGRPRTAKRERLSLRAVLYVYYICTQVLRYGAGAGVRRSRSARVCICIPRGCSSYICTELLVKPRRRWFRVFFKRFEWS